MTPGNIGSLLKQAGNLHMNPHDDRAPRTRDGRVSRRGINEDVSGLLDDVWYVTSDLRYIKCLHLVERGQAWRCGRVTWTFIIADAHQVLLSNASRTNVRRHSVTAVHARNGLTASDLGPKARFPPLGPVSAK